MTRIIPQRMEALRPGSDHPSGSRKTRRPGLGTLLWIGPRRSVYVDDAYSFCDASAAQIAFRSDLEQARRRPCAGVNLIVFCLENDSARDDALFRSIRNSHPHAEALLLLGPLCAGQRPHPSQRLQTPAIYWNEWETYLPEQLIRCGFETAPARRPSSIAVVATRYANADALLSVAASGSASAIWVRPDQLLMSKNIDEFWWDDSATRSGDWNERLDRLKNRSTQHVWLTSMLTPRTRKDAIDAGVQLIVQKPSDLSPLLERTQRIIGQRQRRAA